MNIISLSFMLGFLIALLGSEGTLASTLERNIPWDTHSNFGLMILTMFWQMFQFALIFEPIIALPFLFIAWDGQNFKLGLRISVITGLWLGMTSLSFALPSEFRNTHHKTLAMMDRYSTLFSFFFVRRRFMDIICRKI